MLHVLEREVRDRKYCLVLQNVADDEDEVELALQQEKVFKAFVERYPNIKCVARHVRFAHSCSENSLMAYLWLNGKIYESKRLTFHILDRVGGGDAFVSGYYLCTDE